MRLRQYVFVWTFTVGVAVAPLGFHHHQAHIEASYPQVSSTGVDSLALLDRVQARQVSQVASRSAHRVALHVRAKAQTKVQAKVPTKENVQPSVSRETSDVWAALVQCEAGGNWAASTGNGFYGGPQFTLGTWSAYGGTGVPQSASPSSQITVARRILTTGWNGNPPQGVMAWPVCGPRVGLQPGD